jgi:hypothetical protein
MEKYQAILDVEKFKEITANHTRELAGMRNFAKFPILLYSWHLIPLDNSELIDSSLE